MLTPEQQAKALSLQAWFYDNQRFFNLSEIGRDCDVPVGPFVDWVQDGQPRYSIASDGPWPIKGSDLVVLESWAMERGFRYAEAREIPIQVELRTDREWATRPEFGTILGRRLAEEFGRHIVGERYFEKVDEQTNPMTGEVVSRFRLTILKNETK